MKCCLSCFDYSWQFVAIFCGNILLSHVLVVADACKTLTTLWNFKPQLALKFESVVEVLLFCYKCLCTVNSGICGFVLILSTWICLPGDSGSSWDAMHFKIIYIHNPELRLGVLYLMRMVVSRLINVLSLIWNVSRFSMHSRTICWWSLVTIIQWRSWK